MTWIRKPKLFEGNQGNIYPEDELAVVNDMMPQVPWLLSQGGKK
jgi:hypothetical protein